jgi:hypothetical protein
MEKAEIAKKWLPQVEAFAARGGRNSTLGRAPTAGTRAPEARP